MNGKTRHCIILALIALGFYFSLGYSAQAKEPQTLSIPLYWASDPEGPPPYIFFDPKDPKSIIGFEVDFVTLLSQALGRPLHLVKHDWDTIIPGLSRKLYDMVVNGMVISPEKEEAVVFSKPYYITAGQLITRNEEQEIYALKDCTGKSIGVFKSPELHALLKDYPGVLVRNYENEVNAFSDLAHGRLDAVLVDGIAANYAVGIYPKLKKVGEPIGRMEYAIVLRQEDQELLRAVNQAIQSLICSGELRALYEEWNIWNDLTAEYFGDSAPSNALAPKYEQVVSLFQKETSSVKTFASRLERYMQFLPLLAESALVTLQVSIVAMLFAMVVGFVLAIGRVYGPWPVRSLVTLFIELIRGTPLMIQLLFIYYGLANIGMNLSPFVAGVLGLGINYAAFEAENYRAGILSVPKGQLEAARALGMTQFQGLRHIVLPQAFTTVIPPITNDFISLLKDSSLVSMITIVELSKTYITLAFTYYDFFGIGILVSLIYLLIGLPFVRFARWAEVKLDTARKSYNRIRVRTQ